MDEAAIREDREVKLVDGNRQQQQIPRPRLLPGHAPERSEERVNDFRSIVSAQPIISPHQVDWQIIRRQGESDAIDTGFGIAPLRAKACPDQRPRTFGMDVRQGSGSRIAGQQLVAGKVRLAAEVGGVVEPL